MKENPTRPEDRVRELSASCAPGEVVERLGALARRGKLAGFEAGPGPEEFRVRIFGEMFDRLLEGRAEAAPGGSRVRFRLRLMPLMPALFVAAAVATVWPGMWLTESLLETYIPSAATWWPIWTWYLPLTVLPLPFAGRAMWRKSQAAASAEVEAAMGKMEAALGEAGAARGRAATPVSG